MTDRAGHETPPAHSMDVGLLSRHPGAAARLGRKSTPCRGTRIRRLERLHIRVRYRETCGYIRRGVVDPAGDDAEKVGGYPCGRRRVVLSPYLYIAIQQFWNEPERFDPGAWPRPSGAAQSLASCSSRWTARCIGEHFAMVEMFCHRRVGEGSI